MMDCWRWIGCCSALFLAFVPSGLTARADLIVDDFSIPQSTSNVGGFGSFVNDAGIFGGKRDSNLQVSNSTQQLNIASNLLNLAVTPGVGSFLNSMTLTYNDTTPSEDLGAAGLQNISLADVNATAPWKLTVAFTGTNFPTPATRVITIPSGSSGNLNIPFASFSSPVTGLGNISGISLLFENDTGAAPQISFGPITLSAVPEPCCTGAITLLGILAFAARSRNRWTGESV